ncbi:hypothetical protein TorRG33x02_149670 [Trema orientale]|uniref:Uncharacterized protein n=1 Tax=Trema orientale TaxID=63057 RepID=A0A2P5EU91_TREOI|nr:hypothetical protein TorRG33x02_149670 [Trema orientale]
MAQEFLPWLLCHIISSASHFLPTPTEVLRNTVESASSISPPSLSRSLTLARGSLALSPHIGSAGSGSFVRFFYGYD